ncbi:3-methyl-2-oxobutanoate dehydrogenase [lipoamide] kinase, mitochondrial-like [Pollicipes pollicipes]|uniref:3-methyl-2-oxobutanoate dehydrogenase [lipoamide] kinase, mitochondrial-like n=1 Tax=Pollicipes pollicipes TaxID=41117 RepID=UPI001884AE1A|nr:3-methyl-2-oxobutanoate dehydrogenase [lipoamide] kinase, mitochondrial-like [Pollicipes pollicipes]
MASVGVRTARGRWPAAAGVRRLSDGAGPHRSQPREERARVHHMTSYYNQSAIDAAAAKPSVRLTPATIMYTGKSTDEAHLMVSTVAATGPALYRLAADGDWPSFEGRVPWLVVVAPLTCCGAALR